MKVMTFVTGLMLAVCFCGCAGIEIEPISTHEAEELHASKNRKKGYVVYEPVVVLEITRKKTTVTKGNVVIKETTEYIVGKSLLLPDYTKPYVLDIKKGIAKTDAEFTITDGWRLDNVKDKSDNTGAFKSVLETITTAVKSTPRSEEPEVTKVECEVFLAQVATNENGEVQLTRSFNMSDLFK